MDQSAVLDVEQLVADRRLGAGASLRLFRALTGDGPGNRDRPLWEAAHVLLGAWILLGEPLGRRDDIFELVLDRDRSRAAHFAEKFAGETTRDGVSARGDANGLRLTGDDLTWDSSWPRVADAFALLDALATADDLERCGEVMAAVEALGHDTASASEVVRDCVRALGRIAHDWRRRHMSDVEFDRRLVALLRHLAETGRDAASGRVADDDLLSFWSTRIDAGDRLTFRTALDMGRAVERVAADRRALSALGAAADVNEGGDLDVGDTTTLELDALVEALDRLPARPKFLTGAERAVLRIAFAAAPWHASHPSSLVRAAVFGNAQSLLIEAERRRTTLSPMAAIENGGSYEAYLAEWRALGEHLGRLLRISVTLDPPTDLAVEEVERGRKALKLMRRAGFEAPIEELREVFDEFESDLFMVESGAAKHLAVLDGLDRRRSLASREEADRAVFMTGFMRLYGAREGSK